jgi:hypothetical protein
VCRQLCTLGAGRACHGGGGGWTARAAMPWAARTDVAAVVSVAVAEAGRRRASAACMRGISAMTSLKRRSLSASAGTVCAHTQRERERETHRAKGKSVHRCGCES